MKSKIDENKNDSKRLWEILKSLGYDNKSKSSANTDVKSFFIRWY